MLLTQADALVHRVMNMFEPSCSAIHVAGSVRRRKTEVGDIEFVIIPSNDTISLLTTLLNRGDVVKAQLQGAGGFRWSGKVYRFSLADEQSAAIEFYMTDANSFGYQYWLRTGPSDANTFVMGELIKRSAPIRFQDGEAFWAKQGNWKKVQTSQGLRWSGDGMVKLKVPDEKVMFALLGIDYMQPSARTRFAYERLMSKGDYSFPLQYDKYVISGTERVVNLQTALFGHDTMHDGGGSDSGSVSSQKRVSFLSDSPADLGELRRQNDQAMYITLTKRIPYLVSQGISPEYVASLKREQKRLSLLVDMEAVEAILNKDKPARSKPSKKTSKGKKGK